MMVELQEQRRVIEMLVNNQASQNSQNQPANVPTGSRPHPRSSEEPVLPLCDTPGRTRQKPAASPSVAASVAASSGWRLVREEVAEEIEEIEELLVDAGGPPRSLGPAAAPPALSLPWPGNLTIEEWGTNVVTWGRKHEGKTFANVMRLDPEYHQWCSARYNKLPPEQQDFVRYGQLTLSLAR